MEDVEEEGNEPPMKKVDLGEQEEDQGLGLILEEEQDQENVLSVLDRAMIDLETKPYRVFIVDTETSGFTGIYPSHPRHVMLQICCVDVLTGDVFKSYCSHGHKFKIPPASTAHHGISDDDIQNNGEHVQVVMSNFHAWVNSICKWDEEKRQYEKTPIMVAHNAEFDKEVIRKHFPVPTGRRGELIPWGWYDTLVAFREVYPGIKSNMYKPEYQVAPYKNQPYKLQSLVKHFYPGVTGRFHDAEFDCKCLRRLFLEHLYGLGMRFPVCEPFDEETGKLVVHHKSNPMYARKIPMHVYIKDMKYMWKYLSRIVAVLNYEFLKAGEPWNIGVTNENMISCTHLFYYGWMKTVFAIKAKEITGTAQTERDSDLWWNIQMNVEFMLRDEIDICSDEILLEFFKHIAHCSGVDITHHMKREDTREPMFPTMPGHPVSYKPFQFSEADAAALYKEFGFRSIHDMYVDYVSYIGDRPREWFYRVASKLSILGRPALTIEECTRCFTEVVPGLAQTLMSRTEE